MISNLVRWSLHHRLLVLFIAITLFAWGLYCIKDLKIVAIQDMTDLQVIVKTAFPGQPPEVVEQQVTNLISNAMLSVPSTTKVNGVSLFGDSFVQVTFENDVDLYWARARVYEVLNQIRDQLPAIAKSVVGPDGTRAGWIYEYALIDRSGSHDLAQLRSLQDWYLKSELQSVASVSEVVTVGGMVKQYQIILNPNRLRVYNISVNKIIAAVKQANQNIGGSIIELAEAEYMVRSNALFKKLSDIEEIPVDFGKAGTPILLRDVATIRIGPQLRRGVAELNGIGEVVGGIVIVQRGRDELSTISAVKRKIDFIKNGLPAGVEVIETYDRSILIKRALWNILKLFFVAMIAIAIICFFCQLNTSLIAITTVSLSIIISSLVVQFQGLTLGIISILAGIVGIIISVDAIFLIADKIEQNTKKSNSNRLKVIETTVAEIFPEIFIPYLVIVVSLLMFGLFNTDFENEYGVFSLTLSAIIFISTITLVTVLPVLIFYLFPRSRQRESKKPISLVFTFVSTWGVNNPFSAIIVIGLFFMSSMFPLASINFKESEVLNENDWVYMPTLLTGVSAGKAAELLQITNRIIRTVPEVKTVFGKVGRAETATDSMPLTKIETLITFNPKNTWRNGITVASLKEELEGKLQLPGLINDWGTPIAFYNKREVDDVSASAGVKIIGTNIETIQKISNEIKTALLRLPSVFAVKNNPMSTARYINIEIDRASAARYGLNIGYIQEVINHAIGGANITHVFEDLEKYPVNIRFPQSERNSVEKLKALPLISVEGIHLTLGSVSEILIADGPSKIITENGKLIAWVDFDIDRDNIDRSFVEAKYAVENNIILPSGYVLSWSNRLLDKVNVEEKLMTSAFLISIFIFSFVFVYFKSLTPALVFALSLPAPITGALWLMFLLGFNFSIPGGIGVFLICGVSFSFNMVLLKCIERKILEIKPTDELTLKKSIISGLKLRFRSQIATVFFVIAGLSPVLILPDTGLTFLQGVAAPMIGGIIATFLCTTLILPVLYLLWQRKKFDINVN